MREKVDAVKAELNQVIRGKDAVIEKVLGAICAGGHILLEDVPGVGKTTLALAISKVMSLDYKRIQFTPDVLPGDITGFSMYNGKTGEFEYKEGASMTNLLLADEINRTSPKTQSALLEVMEEGRVTVDSMTHRLPSPFIVIATENPIGSSGTQLLPESQLDRFMICTSLGYPSHNDAMDILKNHTGELLNSIPSVLSREELLLIREQVQNIFVRDSIYDYIVTLTEETRKHEFFSFGASPRASLALLNMAKAMAYMAGRDYVTPKDITYVLPEVFGHRVKLSSLARANRMTAMEALETMSAHIPLPITTSGS